MARKNRGKKRKTAAPKPVVSDSKPVSASQIASGSGRAGAVAASSRKGVAATATEASLVQVASKWDLYLVVLLIFLAATPVIVGPYGQKDGYSPDLHMAAYIQVGALVALFLFTVSIFFRRQLLIPRSPLLLPLLVFYGWAMLSILWTNTKYEAVIDALDWSGAFFFAAMVVLILRDFKYLKLLLFFILLSGLLMALLGIGQYLFGIDWVHQHIVPAATFANKNMAAQYGVLTLPVAVLFFLYTRNVAWIWFHAIAAALILVCIFYTRARGAWVGLFFEIVVLVALLVYLRLRHDKRFFAEMPVRKAALAVSVVLFLGMSYLTPSILGNTAEVMEASIGTKAPDLAAKNGLELLAQTTQKAKYSADKRLTIWFNSLGMFRDHFLVGVGLGNWTIHYAKYQSLFEQDIELTQNKFHAHAHNDYVEILCELGIIGFALFLWVVITLFRLVGRLLSSPDKEHSLFAACLVSVLAGISVNAVFSFPFKQPIPIFIIMTYMAVISNLYSDSAEENKFYTLSLPPVPVKAVAAALALVSVVGIFVFQVNLYKSELHYRHTAVALEKGEFKKAYQGARAAYALNPMRHVLLWMEGTALMQLKKEEAEGEVIELLRTVERYYPYSSNALTNLVNAYSRAQRYQEAAESAARLLSVQPGNHDLRYTYAVSLLNSGQLEGAFSQLKEKVLPVREAKYEKALMLEERLRNEFEGLDNFPGRPDGFSNHLRELHDRVEFARRLLYYIQLRQQAKGMEGIAVPAEDTVPSAQQ